MQDTIIPTVRRPFPPPGIPHLLFKGRSTMPHVGDRLMVSDGRVSITRNGKPLQFRDRNGMELNDTPFPGEANADSVKTFIETICYFIGLGPDSVPSATPGVFIYEFTWH